MNSIVQRSPRKHLWRHAQRPFKGVHQLHVAVATGTAAAGVRAAAATEAAVEGVRTAAAAGAAAAGTFI